MNVIEVQFLQAKYLHIQTYTHLYSRSSTSGIEHKYEYRNNTRVVCTVNGGDAGNATICGDVVLGTIVKPALISVTVSWTNTITMPIRIFVLVLYLMLL